MKHCNACLAQHQTHLAGIPGGLVFVVIVEQYVKLFGFAGELSDLGYPLFQLGV